jgi:hypothetical protein
VCLGSVGRRSAKFVVDPGGGGGVEAPRHKEDERVEDAAVAHRYATRAGGAVPPMEYTAPVWG